MRNRVLPVLLGAALIVGIAASPAFATKGPTATGGGQASVFNFTFGAQFNSKLGVTGSANITRLGSGGYHYYGTITQFSVCGLRARMLVQLAKNSWYTDSGYITLYVWDRGEGSGSSADKVQWVSGNLGTLQCSFTPAYYLYQGNVQVTGGGE